MSKTQRLLSGTCCVVKQNAPDNRRCESLSTQKLPAVAAAASGFGGAAAGAGGFLYRGFGLGVEVDVAVVGYAVPTQGNGGSVWGSGVGSVGFMGK